MSWRYTSNRNRVVTDGNLIKFYEADNNRMYEQAVTRVRYPAAFAFLTGRAGWQVAFNFTRRNSASERHVSTYVLLATPRQAADRQETTYFYVDAKTFLVRRVVTEDAEGNRSRIDFETPRLNPALPPDEFVFAPPPGAEVFRP